MNVGLVGDARSSFFTRVSVGLWTFLLNFAVLVHFYITRLSGAKAPRTD